MTKKLAAALIAAVLLAVPAYATGTASDDPFLNWPEGVETGWEAGWKIPPGSIPDGTIEAPWPFGVAFGDWQIVVYPFERGDEAYSYIQNNDGYTFIQPDFPTYGYEYFLVWLEVTFIGDLPSRLTGIKFSGIDEHGYTFGECSADIPFNILYEDFIPGATRSGFVCVEAPIDLPINLLIHDTFNNFFPVIQLSGRDE